MIHLFSKLILIILSIWDLFLQPFLSRKFKIHDTCGVNNLHGMPGLMAGIGGAIAAAVATEEVYGER